MRAEMKRHPSVDVIIPAYRPDAGLRELLERLEKQTYPAGHILVINTDESLWDPRLTEGIKTAEVFQIPKSRFDHGGTRDMGAGFSNADILLFMTQDAVPKDADLIYRLVQAFRDTDVKAAYARQVPDEHCQIIEGYTRQFNYPDAEMKKTAADLPRLGIKTYFCSNVCAAYDHEMYKEIGGFTRPCIFNEDMIYGGRLIRLGYAIRYVASASVIHSHNYSNGEQFHRYFDNGVSQAMHPEIFKGVPSAREGKKLVSRTRHYLSSIGRGYLIPHLYMQSFCKLAGFRLGKAYRILPKALVMKCTWNKDFWSYHGSDD
jgi:rhamnosyltransferase